MFRNREIVTQAIWGFRSQRRNCANHGFAGLKCVPWDFIRFVLELVWLASVHSRVPGESVLAHALTRWQNFLLTGEAALAANLEQEGAYAPLQF